MLSQTSLAGYQVGVNLLLPVMYQWQTKSYPQKRTATSINSKLSRVLRTNSLHFSIQNTTPKRRQTCGINKLHWSRKPNVQASFKRNQKTLTNTYR